MQILAIYVLYSDLFDNNIQLFIRNTKENFDKSCIILLCHCLSMRYRCDKMSGHLQLTLIMIHLPFCYRIQLRFSCRVIQRMDICDL